MSKHTPGPWRSIAGDIQAQDMDGEWNLTVATGIDRDDVSLIAAAPDLLQALLQVQYAFRDGAGILERTAALMEVERAIQKAHQSPDL